MHTKHNMGGFMQAALTFASLLSITAASQLTGRSRRRSRRRRSLRTRALPQLRAIRVETGSSCIDFTSTGLLYPHTHTLLLRIYLFFMNYFSLPESTQKKNLGTLACDDGAQTNIHTHIHRNAFRFTNTLAGLSYSYTV